MQTPPLHLSPASRIFVCSFRVSFTPIFAPTGFRFRLKLFVVYCRCFSVVAIIAAAAANFAATGDAALMKLIKMLFLTLLLLLITSFLLALLLLIFTAATAQTSRTGSCPSTISSR